jgi:hypothetical protein
LITATTSITTMVKTKKRRRKKIRAKGNKIMLPALHEVERMSITLMTIACGRGG